MMDLPCKIDSIQREPSSSSTKPIHMLVCIPKDTCGEVRGTRVQDRSRRLNLTIDSDPYFYHQPAGDIFESKSHSQDKATSREEFLYKNLSMLVVPGLSSRVNVRNLWTAHTIPQYRGKRCMRRALQASRNLTILNAS